jgi:predicted TIM-barrel fold metal-dependent hydrolase
MAGIVDTHTHLLPERLARRIRRFFEHHITVSELVFPIDHEVVLERLYQVGIEEVWTLPYAHKGGMAAELNRSMATIVKEHADKPVAVIGGATVHPHDENLVDILKEAFDELGLRVLKLHCSVGNYSPDDPALSPVWEFVSARRIPVVVHVGHAVSGHTHAHELAPVEQVAQKFPEARIIIAHCAHRDGPQALDLLEKYPSVYADLTPVVHEPVALPAERVRQLSHKLLYGSDAPNVALTPEQCIAHVRSFGLDSEAENAILGNNARRLLSEIL